MSVIVPTYNRLDLTLEAVRRVKDQTYREFQIIVVDDGSTDGADVGLRQIPDVIYLRQKNAGPSAARNLGVTHARGRYLAFLDSDDGWESGFLSRCMEMLRETRAGFAFANWRIVNGVGDVIVPDAFAERPRLLSALRDAGSEPHVLEGSTLRDLFIRKSFIMPSGIVFDRSVFRHDWDETLHVGEDQQFILRGLFDSDVTAAVSMERLWVYRFHDANHCTRHRDGVKISAAEIQAKERLMQDFGGRISGRQRRALQKSIGSSYFDLGYHLSKRNEKIAARHAWCSAFRSERSFRSLAAVLRTYLPID